VFLYAVKDFWNIADYTRNIYPEIFGLSAIEISRFAAIPIIFSTLFLIINKNSKLLIKIFLLLIILFCLFQMLQSGTRGPVLGLLISFLIYLLYSDINKRSKSFIIAGFSLFIITFYLLVGQDSLLIDRALLLTEENAIESQNRYFRIVTFFELFPDHFLLGIGPGNWPDYVIDDQYPHNIFLEVIIELGLLGLILIAGLLLTCYRYLSDILTFISSDALSIGVVLLWFAMFFSFSLSGTVASTPFFSHCALLASTYLINKSYIQL
jgi:O-antigen ligase